MILVLASGAGNAQSAPATQDQPSLADAARSARAQQAKSKVVVDNDNLKSQPKSPIPDIDMDSASENSDEVIKAIFDYRTKHTRDETEDLVHEWYDRFDRKEADAYTENRDLRERREALNRHRSESIAAGRYEQYRKTAEADARGAQEDQRRMNENFATIMRVQDVLRKVRSALIAKGMRYEWFKFRCGVNYCNS